MIGASKMYPTEVHERLTPKKIAQIDLCKNYQTSAGGSSEKDAGKGLHRMIVDIASFYLNYIRSHGMPIDESFIDMVQRTYYNTALSFVKSYSDDAESNGLIYDRHKEEQTVSYFRDFIGAAWEQARARKAGRRSPRGTE